MADYLTPIHALPAPEQLPAGAGPDVPLDIRDLADAVDPLLTPFIHGAGTPADIPVAAGKVGRRYRNDVNGDIYLDIGAGWILEGAAATPGNGIDIDVREVSVLLAAVPGLEFSGGALRAKVDGATLERDGDTGSLQVKDLGITAAKIAAALKPSGGAAAATEALRALGVAAGTAAAGNDGRIPTAGEKAVLTALAQATVVDLLDALVPVGSQIAGPWAALPGIAGGVEFQWADGGLIDKTTYAQFFAAAAHRYNGGVDPGSNRVRKPDKRGRVAVGADNMGTGAAGRLPNNNRAVGQNGGEEQHALATGEMPSHNHGGATGGGTSGGADRALTVGGRAAITGHGGFDFNFVAGDSSAGVGSLHEGLVADHLHSVPALAISSQGGGGAHNNLQPYEVDAVIVRVA